LKVLAQRYARALADVALEHRQAEQVKKELSEFRVLVAESVDLRNFLASPAVPQPQKQAVVGKLVERLGASKTVLNFLLVLMGILPLTAGMRDAISHKRAEKELIKQYRFMARIFANARRILGSAGTVPFQRRVLKALGEAALEEGAEWILMHRSRPLEHKGLG